MRTSARLRNELNILQTFGRFLKSRIEFLAWAEPTEECDPLRQELATLLMKVKVWVEEMEKIL